MQSLVKMREDHSSWKISPLPAAITAPLKANVFSGRHPSAHGVSGFWISKTDALLERLTHPVSQPCSTSALGILRWHCSILPEPHSAITYLKFHCNLCRGLKVWSGTVYEQCSLLSLALQWFAGGKHHLKSITITLKMSLPATVFGAADTFFFFWTPDSQKQQPFERRESSDGACGMKPTEDQNLPL